MTKMDEGYVSCPKTNSQEEKKEKKIQTTTCKLQITEPSLHIDSPIYIKNNMGNDSNNPKYSV